jgi:hypothetical protein
MSGCDDGPAVEAPVDAGTSFLELHYCVSASAPAAGKQR